MKKRLSVLLCGIMLLLFAGCDKKEIEKQITDDYDYELFQCIEKQLGSYLNDDLIEIPLSEIKNSDFDKIAYYKGVYSKENKDNIYVMVFPKNGTYESRVMKDFDKYFYNQFSVYQMFESSLTPTIYLHTKDNDVDFNDIVNQCVTKNSSESKSLPSKTINELNNTKKIVIKNNNQELGIIDNDEKLNEILSAITSSKQSGDAFLCDGNSFNFEMYDSNNKLIDTILVWGDGKRLIPESIHNGCSYYSISNNVDLRKIIEEETDYIFYGIFDYRDDYNQKEQLIYQEGDNSYYIPSDNINEITIKFMLNNQIMPLKYALENKYISAEKVASEYPDILIRK